MGVRSGEGDSPIVDPKQISRCLKWWQRVLNIEHWRIDYKVVPREKMTIRGSLMEVRPTTVRHHATIYIREDVLEKFDCVGFQQLLVHELTHLIYDPLVEEHNLQTEFSGTEERRTENNVRFTRVLEQAVEHTAQMLCRILPFRAEWTDDFDDEFNW